MKHATKATLKRLSGLLEQIRMKEEIKEKSLGIFYRKSKSFLHFHEDAAALFADLRAADDGFRRYRVNTKPEWRALLSVIDGALL